jgi:photosystem II stability/assembly factor-like uncharacterized protein
MAVPGRRGSAVSLLPFSYPIISLDASDASRLFIVDYNDHLLRTNDGGASWQPAVTGVLDSRVDSLSPDPSAAGTALVIADGAIQATADGGRHWTDRPTPPGTPHQIARAAGGDPSLLYVVSTQTDAPFTLTLYRSEDGGTTWQPIRTVTGDESCTVSVTPTASAVVYFACQNAGLVRSSDGGSTWGPARRLPFVLSPSARPAITVDPRDPNVVYAATAGQGVYRSRDGGSTWQQLTASPVDAEHLAQSPLDPDVLYVVGFTYQAGSDPITLRRSGDGGRSWHKVPTPGWVRDVAVGKNGVIYASMWLQQNSLVDTIMASPDGGATWTDIGGGADGHVAAISGPSPGRLWAIGFGGVHSRPGLAWTGPRLSGTLSVRLDRGATLVNGRVPLILHWPAATGASPICGYRVQAGASGGVWSTVGRVGPGSLRHVLVRPDQRTGYRVQAVACSGAVSTWIVGTPIVAHVAQENAAAVETSGGWRRVIDARASAGAQLVAIGGGAALAFHATAVTDIALVSTTGPAGGWPHVRINLGTAALVSQRSAAVDHRRIVFTRHLAEPEAVYLTVRSGGVATARTTVDAIVTLRLAPAAGP